VQKPNNKIGSKMISFKKFLEDKNNIQEHTNCGTSDCCGNCETSVLEGSETWEAGYKRRVVKTTNPDHKEKGMNWRIKGKDRPEISIKLYKEKPSQAEFNKQMRRVAGHEFGG
jgi:ferredoxin